MRAIFLQLPEQILDEVPGLYNHKCSHLLIHNTDQEMDALLRAGDRTGDGKFDLSDLG